MTDAKLLSLVPMLVGGILLATLDTTDPFVIISCVGLILIGAVLFLGPVKIKKTAARRKK
ncbi:hypothetical protein HY346_00280 [Candidatus Microgenomates bacterium]|nr:hypothetical protein [Candidatus Microgenomates bacterium]